MGKSGAVGDVISLPSGGGAVHGVGETFSSDLFTGTGSFKVPLATPPGRNGFQPQIALVYSSGSGNGAFGLGWSVSVPGVARKTSSGIPTYGDADVFILSGAEDLAIVSADAGVVRYRPRTEGIFARILHRKDAASDLWEVGTRDGLVSTYGGPGAVVADPADARRISAWKLASTVDTFGNRIEYAYESDTATSNGQSFTQTFLSEIRYVDYAIGTTSGFLVHVFFRYEDRPDPFSDYRGGFEVRTRRRCRRIDVFTEAGASTLVRTYHLEYLDDAGHGPMNGVSLLSRIRVEGAGHDDVPAQELPPISFAYTDFEPGKQRFIPLTGDELPVESLAHPDYDLVDLSGGGLPDILQMNGVSARWWKNRGGGRFDRPRTLKDVPGGVSLGGPGVQLLDADGDGRADLMVTRGAISGYYPIVYGGTWDPRSFHRFARAPSFDLRDPEVRLVDLDGDGVTDALRSGSSFECFFNDPIAGWSRTRSVARRAVEEFPDVDFSDPHVKWADMTGDGLTDIVLVHQGRVDYWPNRGFGDFGPRVSMTKAPHLPEGYDPKRLLVGDVDGDGCADMVYVGDAKVTIWINRSGNRFADPVEIHGTPRVTDVDAIRLADLLGNGVAGVLWSSDASFAGRPWMFFLDLTGGTKPYLLNAMDNGMGATTRVAYAPSTRYYLEDEKCGETRWKSHLPFPVQVVARVEVVDAISLGKLTTEYSYHHGYWDGVERELRGFGRVDHRDTETFAVYDAPGLHGPGAPFNHVDTFFSPPTETRTWFHQGPVGDREKWVETDFSGEFWSGDPTKLSDFAEPKLTSRDAVRTLRGQMIRSELYALDGSDREKLPYTVTESLAGVSPVGSTPGVYLPHILAGRVTQWERGDDPLTSFTFTGDIDVYGQPCTSIAIAVPRTRAPSVPDPCSSSDQGSAPYLATLGRTTFAQREDATHYMVDRTSSSTSYEVVNDGSGTVSDLYRAIQAGTASLRAIGQSIHYYDGDAFVGLPFSILGDHGAPMRSESLVFTDEILSAVHQGGAIPPYLSPSGAVAWTSEYPVDFRSLPKLAGYVHYTAGTAAPHLAGYFVQSERRKYDFHLRPDGKGLVEYTEDAMGRQTFVGYDAYRLLPIEVQDPAGLTTKADYDYRVLQPSTVTDANGNATQVRYSALGLVEALVTPLDLPNKPSTSFVFDLTPFATSGKPVSVRTIQLVKYSGDPSVPTGTAVETIERLELSDGFGRVVQVRAQAEDVAFGDGTFGGGLLSPDQTDAGLSPIVGTPADPAHPRVVVSGAQTFDNKGRVVEKYEPVFSKDWAYEPPDTLPRGQKVTLYYDPLGRMIRTVFPDGSEVLVVRGIPPDLTDPTHFAPTPWEAFTYDQNDNAGRTHPNDPDAKSYQTHWNTPSSAVVDALGRTVRAVERNGTDTGDLVVTGTTYDIQGNALTITDPLCRTAFRYTYDLAKHALRSESVDAGVKRVTLDASGNPIEHRDAKGALGLSAYDEAGRAARLWARDAVHEAITLREVRFYGGDAEGIGLTDDQAKKANLLGKPYRVYDEAGEETFAAYDFAGRLMEKSRRVVADKAILSVFGSISATGHVKAFRVDWSSAGSTLLKHAETLLDATVFETSMKYDALGRVTRLRYPKHQEGARKELVPSYNRAGALESVSLAAQTYVDRIIYDAKGQRAMIAYGNGVMTRYAYDPHVFKLVRARSERYARTAPLTYEPRGGTLQEYGHAYDLAGNILRIDDRTPGSGVTGGPDELLRQFAYDPLYRLLSANGREADIALPATPWEDGKTFDVKKTRTYVDSYGYDKAGNLTSIGRGTNAPTRVLALVDGSNRLARMTLGRTVYRYTYDDNGNLTRETEARRFEWDHSDRMRVFQNKTGSAKPSVHVHYLYDSGGQRIKKLVWKGNSPVETAIYIDGVFERRTEESLASDALHVMDGEQRIALLRAGAPLPGDEGAPAVKYQLGDHLGSVVAEVDGAGTWMSREEYSPYGETTFGGYAKKRYRFTGKEREGESGLYYHGARYYAPWVGRWASSDPSGAKGGLNSYRYASSNPMILTDPTGLAPDLNELMTQLGKDPMAIYSVGPGAVLDAAFETLRRNNTPEAREARQQDWAKKNSSPGFNITFSDSPPDALTLDIKDFARAYIVPLADSFRSFAAHQADQSHESAEEAHPLFKPLFWLHEMIMRDLSQKNSDVATAIVFLAPEPGPEPDLEPAAPVSLQPVMNALMEYGPYEELLAKEPEAMEPTLTALKKLETFPERIPKLEPGTRLQIDGEGTHTAVEGERLYNLEVKGKGYQFRAGIIYRVENGKVVVVELGNRIWK